MDEFEVAVAVHVPVDPAAGPHHEHMRDKPAEAVSFNDPTLTVTTGFGAVPVRIQIQYPYTVRSAGHRDGWDIYTVDAVASFSVRAFGEEAEVAGALDGAEIETLQGPVRLSVTDPFPELVARGDREPDEL